MDEKANGKSWIIQVKKGENTKKFEEYEDDDELEGLYVFLSLPDNLTPFKSLDLGGAQTVLTFAFDVEKVRIDEKEEETKTWKILAKEYIDAWVDTVSKKKATLKIKEDLSSLDLQGLVNFKNSLEDQKSVFEEGSLGGATESQKKTILFEKDGSSWKHTKSEIENWLKTGSGSKFSIEIQKDNEEKKDLNGIDETNLTGLLTYLRGEENTLTKLVKDSAKTLTFENKNNNWNVIHNQNTINNWISNISGKQITLELYENTGKKTTLNESEWKEVFDSIKDEVTLFTSSDNSGTIIFEKYTHSTKKKTWTHIKEAIKDYWEVKFENGCGDEEYYDWNANVKVKTTSNQKEAIEKIKEDSGLIGLLSHIQNNESECKKEEDKTYLIFEKTDSTWKGTAADSI